MKNTRKVNNITLSELRTVWHIERAKEKAAAKEAALLKSLKRHAGAFKGKDLTNVSIKRGKKAYAKCEGTFVELQLI